MNVKNDRYLIFDLETTGLMPERHQILSLGVAILDNWKVVDNREFNIRFEDGFVAARALEVNQIDLRTWNANAKPLGAFTAEFFEYVDRWFPKLEINGDGTVKKVTVPLGGHNVINFDVQFMRRLIDVHTSAFHNTKFESVFSYRFLDTMVAAMFLGEIGVIKPKAYSLDTLLDYFAIPRDSTKRHSAGYDALKSAQLFIKMKECVWELISKT